MVLLSTAYFPTIEYCSKLISNPVIYIEQHEHFIKQSYRNRAEILAANGPVPLVIPVVKGRGGKTEIKDLQISYDEDWRQNHWRTIFSAYNSSPFFEYYADDFEPLFLKKYKFLLDLNLDILKLINELLEIEPEIRLTNGFEQIPEDCTNLREFFHPKAKRRSNQTEYKNVEYTQVFSEKSGFVPNLSILDLLFNTGPQTYSIIEDGISRK